MLQATIKPHRATLRAYGGQQKLFALLKLLPTSEAARARPTLHLAIVVDTSGSMRHKVAPEEAAGAAGPRQSKLQVASAAARRLIESSELRPDDRIAIIQFDVEARVVAQGRAGVDRARLLAGIDALGRHSGITRMSAGLWQAERELRTGETGARKVLLLTDGRTLAPDECLAAARALRALQAPIVAAGLGDSYNEALLRDLGNLSLGHPVHVRDPQDVPALFEAELRALTRQVVHARLLPRTLPDVDLVALTRVYPSLAEVEIGQDEIDLGTITAGDYTVFALELDVPERPALAVRLAQIALAYDVPGLGQMGNIGPLDLVVTFTAGAPQAALDEEVMGYIQQRNTDRLVRQASELARRQPEQAAGLLQQARTITQRWGNTSMTIALGQAEAELRNTGRLRPGTLKTINLGVRTRTVRLDAGAPDIAGRLDADDIRRLTGA